MNKSRGVSEKVTFELEGPQNERMDLFFSTGNIHTHILYFSSHCKIKYWINTFFLFYEIGKYTKQKLTK